MSKPYTFRLQVEHDENGDTRLDVAASLDLAECENLADYLADLAASMRREPLPVQPGEAA